MSELTTAQYSRNDIFNPDRWVDYHDDTLFLLDPATGDPLKTDQPPEWLASDPRLAEGYQALGDPAYAHDLTIALSKHTHASDLGKRENRFTRFERMHSRSHAAAFEEGGGYDRAGWDRVIKELRSYDTWPPGLSESPTFSDRLLRSILRNKHVREFSYDVEKTDKPIDNLLVEMFVPDETSQRWQEMPFAIQHTLRFAAHAMREWYVPGKYMHELLKLDLPDSPRVLLTIGAGHGDVERKFDILGTPPKIRRFPLSRSDRDTAETWRQAMRAARINFQKLGSLTLD